MSETLNTIFTRRSFRSYGQEQIPDEALKVILEAGKFAPSAMNQQPWHFTVVQNKGVLHKINETLKNIFLKSGNPAMIERVKAEDFSPFYNAPTLIIVSGDSKAVAPEADCSLALGNMFLAAEALDIGSCWINSLRSLGKTKEGVSLIKELEIPEGYIVFGSGAFGYKGSAHPEAPARVEGTVTFIR